MKQVLTLVIMASVSLLLTAAPPATTRPNSADTEVSPAFFGPNAFPVPQPMNGRTSTMLRAEVAGDGYFHTAVKDNHTADLFARLYIPLFTKRVNLTVWMPVYEWYNQPQEGGGAGDVYLSTDIWLLQQKQYIPDIAIRAALKTASGGQYDLLRHFDSPGYWFDLSCGKSFYFARNAVFPYAEKQDEALELRLSGDIGFLCWQTDNERQNDALYYALQLMLLYRSFCLEVTWAGYSGWEHQGDKPMTVKAHVGYLTHGFEPYLEYQYGIRDYPYHMFRIGLAYNINILKNN